MLDLLSLTEPAYRAGYLSYGEAQAPAQRAAGTPAGPTFNVVVPLYAPPMGYLRHAVQSVLAQTWPHWQLILVDDANGDAALAAYGRALAAEDPRVVFVQAASHGHISRATNLGIAQARNTWTTFLDQDDALAPTALEEVAACVTAAPDLQLVYTDEDRIDPFGARFLPYFKPAWSPDLLRSQNYVCHLAVYRHAFLQKLGGLREGLEGSQDHDLALRAAAALRPHQIAHLPRILYHWRTLDGSTATHGAAAKPYALAAGTRAIRDALEASQAAATVAMDRGFYRVRWQVPQPLPRVHVVLHGVAAKRCRQAAAALTKATRYASLTVDVLAATQDAAGTDAAIHAAILARAHASDVVVLVAGEVATTDPGWLLAGVGLLQRPDVGFVAGKVVDPAGTVLSLGLVLDPGALCRASHAGAPAQADGYFGRALLTHNVAAVSRACCATTTAHWLELGGFRPGLVAALADVDLSLRSRARGRIHVAEPRMQLTALDPGDARHETAFTAADAAGIQARWGAALACDAYTSPHLAVTPTSHSLRTTRPQAPAWRVAANPTLGAGEA